MRRAFRAFDRGAKGYVSLRDLEAAVAAVSPSLPRQTVTLAFGELDADRDGRVAYGEFVRMMTARPGGRAAPVGAVGLEAMRPPPREPLAAS